MKLFTFLAAFVCATLTAPAQVTLAPTSVDLPPGHSAILDLYSFYGEVSVMTTDEMWWYRAPTGGSPVGDWSNVLQAGSYNIRLYTLSRSIVDPSEPHRVLLSTMKDGRWTIVGLDVGHGDRSDMDLGAIVSYNDFPSGLAAAPNGTLYVANTSGIQVYAGFATTPSLTNSFTAPAELSFGSLAPQLQFGADDVLYALDREHSRVLRFSEDGDFLNSFEIAADSQSFAVSDSGFLFVATNSAEMVRDGYIYDALTGSLVGTFDLPEDHDELSTLGRGAMAFFGDALLVVSPGGAQLHSYDVSGFTAIPEPSTYAALLGAGALGFACWRRRRASVAAGR